MSRSRKDIQPNWRPNFVDSADLPDIKVIRTNFLINIVAITLLSACVATLVYREYQIQSIKSSVKEISQQVSEATPANEAGLELSAKFRKAAKPVAEVETFYLSPFLAHDFLARLSDLRPENMVFDNVTFRESGNEKKVSYRVSISGDVRSLTTLDDFKGVLNNWDMLAIDGYDLSVDETIQARDADTGIFPFQLVIALQPSSGKGSS